MRISSRFEQGVYVVIILALEKDHAPVKSGTMSRLLDVSDSYLKKILMKLSHSGLVCSSANKRGGYTLSRGADQISLKDVFLALDEGEDFFVQSDYAKRLFPHQAHVKESTDKIVQAIDEGLDDFYSRLDELKISDLLEDGAWQNGALDWEARLLELKGK
ncbi:MAG: RrF2 family transcriptional regulator [Tractidigestivibacter sp.]|jgi:Rrf2 family protein|uniref:RrF2 family transcriptional regulator n=1 Tax=Tractidigestivibacter sp. TaxID=2847320 RepID=UPI003D92123B